MKITSFGLASTLLLCTCAAASAQISFTSAVGLALANSPRVKIAEADVSRARAALEQTRDVFIPTIVGTSSGAGYSYGFPLGTPTVFSFSAQSLVFSYSQRDYIRAATSGLAASDFALRDVRDQVAEDAAVTYLSLDRARQQRAALAQESAHVQRLESIVKDRVDAGQDNTMEFTRTRRTGVAIRLQVLQLEDEIASFQDHLARLMNLPAAQITTATDSIPVISAPVASEARPDTFAVQAAYATARSKQEQAFGDSRYAGRPQFYFGGQYSRFSTYNNNYATYYPGIQNQPNAIGLALDITLPVLDMGRRAKARESLADALHFNREAAYIRDQVAEGRLKLEHSTTELAARAELASLDRDLAQEQLDIVLLRIQAVAGPAGAPLVTPKDEQNARIQERQRFIEMLDADFQLKQARINLLRQSGQLETWLKSVMRSPPRAQALTSVP